MVSNKFLYLKSESYWWETVFDKFSPNLLNELICEARARAKQSLLRRSWPLQSDREIPGNRQDLETKV